MLNLQLIHHCTSLKRWLPGVQLQNARWKSVLRSRGRQRWGRERQHCLRKVLLPHQGAARPPHAPEPWLRPPAPQLPLPLQCIHAHMSLADKCISHAYADTPCTLSHTSCTLTSHTRISHKLTHTHLAHLPQPPSCCGIRPFLNTTKRKTWQWHEGPLSSASLLFGTSGDSAVGQRKLINFFWSTNLC